MTSPVTDNNSIYRMQKEHHLQNCLYAQWFYYRKAKRVSSLHFWAVIVLLGVSSIVNAVVNIQWVSDTCVIATIVLLLSDLFFAAVVSRLRNVAADIQQFVDVSLFATPKYREDWGDVLTTQQTYEWISKVNTKKKKSFKQWYSDYSSLHHYKQVIHCQSENIRWNRDLSKSYLWFICGVSSLCFLAFIVIEAVVLKASIINTFRVLIWFSPLLQYLIRAIIEIIRTDKKKQRLRAKIDSVLQNENEWDDWGWEKREIAFQREIYELRKSSVMVPDWYYRITKKKYEKREKSISKQTKENEANHS